MNMLATKVTSTWMHVVMMVAVATVAPGCGGGSNTVFADAPTAGEVVIWPDELIDSVGNQASLRSLISVSSSIGALDTTVLLKRVSFYAEVVLPVGCEITGLSYYHSGRSADAQTSVQLWRGKIGENAEFLFDARSTADTGFGQVLVDGSALASDFVVRGDSRYWVDVNAENSESAVLGVKVAYE